MDSILGIQKNILILGGGYGGLRTALELQKHIGSFPGHRVVIVDQNQHHQLITQLHEVAGGRTPPEAVAIPFHDLLGKRGIEHYQARVTGVDFDGHQVHTDGGDIPYDKLVIAIGSETNFYNIPGMQEHAFSLKSVGDACLIQGHIHETLAAASALSDLQERRAALTFVVGGGGFTGVELAAELADGVRRLASRYAVSPDEVRVIIVEAGKDILPGLNPRLIERARHDLQQKGVELMLGTPARAADATGMILASGQRIDSRTMVWSGGVRAPEALQRWGLPTGPGGRVKVNKFLEVEEYPGVYVIGDAVLVMDGDRPAPPSAQLAIAQGDVAARNILARMTDSELVAYKPHMVGEAVSLGPRDGIAWIGPLHLYSLPAQWLKGFIANRYIWETGGFRLLQTYQSLGRGTLAQDFPQCVVGVRPETTPATANAA